MLASKLMPPDFPDDPRKWDGWSKYRGDNPYERLCLDPRAHPTEEQIQQHCAALLQWWQNKLPLKNQPSNPLAQLLGRGLDESSRYLVEARIQLLDPLQRRRIDDELAARSRRETLDEFAKFVRFSIKGGILTSEAEANLVEFGQRNGFDDDQIRTCIEEVLSLNKARRPAAPTQGRSPSTPANAATTEASEKEYIRILRLGALNMASASYTVRAMLAQIAENLGIAPPRAEQLLDNFLEEQELVLAKAPPPPVFTLPKVAPAVRNAAPVAEASVAPAMPSVPTKPFKSRFPVRFLNPVGATMVLLPPGEFTMGSAAPDAAPNEQPLTPVTLSEFYISLYPVTNVEYEQFDPRHQLKRIEGGGGDHPVVYVTSFDAVKYCEWLSQKDGRKYRLPTEAEWEYAARGTDGRKYPWGNQEGQGDLGNFADMNTPFPWRDASINDGFAQTSPVGAFPRGVSSFGLEDMAGNVWEWCLDFFQPLAGSPKQNPRGPASGAKRVYRGGSWKSRFSNLRATARASNAPNYSCNDLGFRLVCECDRDESA